MRKATLGVPASDTIAAKLKWLEDSVRILERASYGSEFGELLATARDIETAALLLTGWRVIGASAVAVSHTGDTTEWTAATIAVDAGAMGANGILRVTTLWTTTNSANNKTLRVKYDTTAFLAHVATAQASQRHQTIIQNRNSESAQVSSNAANSNDFASTASAVTTGTVNSALAKNITITGQLATAGETVTLEGYLVELCKKT